jgi:hypothetical protein
MAQHTAAPTLHTSNAEGKSFERLYDTDAEPGERYDNAGRAAVNASRYYWSGTGARAIRPRRDFMSSISSSDPRSARK